MSWFAFNPVYAVARYYADKHRRIFFGCYLGLIAFLVGVTFAFVHSGNYLIESGQCRMSSATSPNSDAYNNNSPSSSSLALRLNCFLAELTKSIASELLLLYFFAIQWVLPHANHILGWMAFWAIVGNVWPVLWSFLMGLWAAKRQLGVAILWVVVYYGSILGRRTAEAFIEEVALQLNGTSVEGAIPAPGLARSEL